MSGNHNMNQKPVAWFHEEKYKTHFTTDPSEDMIGKYWQPLYTAPLTVSMQEPVGEVLNERGEIDYISYVPPVGTPLYAAPQSINDFKPDWDTVKAYDEKFAEMLDEQQRLRAELKRTEQRLHDVATLCANVEGVLKAVNTAAMKLTADLTCMDVDNDDRLDRDHVMERVMRWRNEWDKAMFEYKPKAAPRHPLTDEQIDDIWNRYCDEMGEASINDAYDIARAIEAAHGIGEMT